MSNWVIGDVGESHRVVTPVLRIREFDSLITHHAFIAQLVEVSDKLERSYMFTVVYREKGKPADVFYTRYIAEVYASFCEEGDVRIIPGRYPYAQWGE